MTLSGLLPLLTRNSQFGELIDALRLGMGREAIVAPDPATAYLVAAIWREFGAPVVVVTPNPEAARRLSDQLGVWRGDAPIFQFAETENIPFEHYVPDMLSTHQRLQALAALIDPPTGEKPVVVASIQAVAQSTIDRATFDQATRHDLRRRFRLAGRSGPALDRHRLQDRTDGRGSWVGES